MKSKLDWLMWLAVLLLALGFMIAGYAIAHYKPTPAWVAPVDIHIVAP